MREVRIAFVAVCLLTGATYAAPNLGTWTAPGTFPAGTWQELFLGGGPGQAGNVISATAGNWNLAGATLLTVAPYVDPTYHYMTTYVNGVLTLGAGGPWDGGGAPYTANLGPLVVLSSGDPSMTGFVTWTMQGSGVLNGSGLDVSIGATYSGQYTLIPGPPMGMTGNITSAQISIVPVPGALLLGALGTGLVTWLRRRKTF